MARLSAYNFPALTLIDFALLLFRLTLSFFLRRLIEHRTPPISSSVCEHLIVVALLLWLSLGL